jgi:hypothetical protein
MFGNPFQPVPLDPARRTPRVVNLARGSYDRRPLDGLPSLADALEEAGCASQDTLAHRRGPGPHVQGRLGAG